MTIDRFNIPINAGDLDHQVEIQRKSVTISSTGAEIISWVPFAQKWTKVVPQRAREFLRADQIQAQVTSAAVVRYEEGLVADMRLVHAGVIYNIEGVIPDPRLRRHQTLMLSQGINQG